MKIKSVLQKSNFLVNLYKEVRYYIFKNFFSDEELIKYRFRKNVGRKVELDEPIKFNDKLQWLKLRWYDSLAVKCADKYEVRQIVKDRIGEDHLNKIYAVYNSIDEIDFNKLPNSFVLKATHGSGDNIICKDKSQINKKTTLKILKKALKKNLYWPTREWVYKDIKPRIICEKYLSDERGDPPVDYKFFCFNGEPKLIQVDIDRFGYHNQHFYSTNWENKNIKIGATSNDNQKLQRPDNLDEMLELSKKLSKGFPHVRVDLYNIEDSIIFGELTFFHRSGFSKIVPQEFEKEMGNWLILPK